MRILLLAMLMIFAVIPCQAADFYNMKFSDSNGVFTGNENIVICTMLVPNKEGTVAEYLVDLKSGMTKVFKVDGRKVEKDHNWDAMRDDLYNEIVAYAAENRESILQASRSRPQSAYSVD